MKKKRTKSKDFFVYKWLVAYKNLEELDLNELAKEINKYQEPGEKPVTAKKLAGHIRAAKYNDTIYIELLDIGYSDYDIPTWFTRPKAEHRTVNTEYPNQTAENARHSYQPMDNPPPEDHGIVAQPYHSEQPSAPSSVDYSSGTALPSSNTEFFTAFGSGITEPVAQRPPYDPTRKEREDIANTIQRTNVEIWRIRNELFKTPAERQGENFYNVVMAPPIIRDSILKVYETLASEPKPLSPMQIFLWMNLMQSNMANFTTESQSIISSEDPEQTQTTVGPTENGKRTIIEVAQSRESVNSQKAQPEHAVTSDVDVIEYMPNHEVYEEPLFEETYTREEELRDILEIVKMINRKNNANRMELDLGKRQQEQILQGIYAPLTILSRKKPHKRRRIRYGPA
jgi:hypothetical protein